MKNCSLINFHKFSQPHRIVIIISWTFEKFSFSLNIFLCDNEEAEGKFMQNIFFSISTQKKRLLNCLESVKRPRNTIKYDIIHENFSPSFLSSLRFV
jgi:hypothetical protein